MWSTLTYTKHYVAHVFLSSNEAHISVSMCSEQLKSLVVGDPHSFSLQCPVFLCNYLQSLQVYDAF